jgi:putative YhdH/YhfP family quinone oxidoreductase
MTDSMTDRYLAWRLEREDEPGAGALREMPLAELRAAGGVLVRGAWAGVNFKDALSARRRAKIVRRYPCTLGIEVAGTVEASDDPRFVRGDPVIVHGFGLAADRDGGFSQYVQAPADMVVPLPATLSLQEAGTIGVAGYTAALAIDAMQLNGFAPGNGPVAVNGATGGVASIAIDMLAGLGAEVHAISRKPDDGWLRALGAAQVIAPPVVGDKPLERAAWAGAVDSLGGQALDALLRTMAPDGVVASFGNAAGNGLSTSVLPFILRGVRLIGINANSPMPLRRRIWERIGSDLRPRHADLIGRPIPMAELPAAFDALLAGQGRGRFVVDLGR